MNPGIQSYHSVASENQRERLILDNLGFVRKILSTVAAALPRSYDRENLEQAGIVALVQTANNYDPSLGISFRTYSFPRIRGAMIDEIRKNSPVPQQMQEMIRSVRLAHQELEPPVLPEDLAEHTGLTIEQVHQVLEAMRFTKPQHWNDLYCNVHSTWRAAPDQPGADLENRELKRIIADQIQRLPERERLVLTMYFTEDLTLAEIGKVIGVSESRVSRILASAKFRLKELVQASL